jgi:hypothetical protein
MYLVLNHLLSYFFFQFHPFTIDFMSYLFLIFFNCSVSGIQLFIKLFFFQIHPFALDFYIRFGHHSFNCDVFGLKSFIELICLWISSLDILFLYQIWFLFFRLLFLVVLILFYIEILFQFHPLWFGFIWFLCQI